MRFRLPRNCGAVSHAGSAVAIAADASVELDSEAIALLQPHAIQPFDDPVPIDKESIGTMSVADLTTALTARAVTIPRNANDKTLRGLLRQVLAAPTR